MIPDEQVARIRHLFHAEHWKIGTIAAELLLHPDTVRRALETGRFRSQPRLRAQLTDPYLDFLRQTLQQYPRLRTTRLLQMIQPRGYTGSVSQLRRVVADLRPPRREAFLRLRVFPGEQAQSDWAYFGEVRMGRARRRLSGFVLTLSYSRALWLEFFFDQSLENFLLGHVHAFHDWGGTPRSLQTDNLRSVVLERRGDAIHFHPRFLELSAHYHFATLPCRPARGNEKGRVSALSSTYVPASSPPAPSPPWRISIARRSLGATRSLINGLGRVVTPAAWLKSSRKRNRACCLFPPTRSPASWCAPCTPIRPSGCASTSTIIPCHLKPWAAL